MSMINAEIEELREKAKGVVEDLCDIITQLVEASIDAGVDPILTPEVEPTPAPQRKKGARKKAASKKKAAKKKAPTKKAEAVEEEESEESEDSGAYAADADWIEACKEIRAEHGDEGTAAIKSVLVDELGLGKVTEVIGSERTLFLERVNAVLAEA